MGRRGGEEEEEEARWVVDKASERVEKGDAEGALRLLEQAQRLRPGTPGLPELVALAQVCHAASCSAPHWYRILMVSEKDDLTAIRKRYRQLALLLHPDKNKHTRAEEAFKLVSEAYSHLSDGKKRETFDLSIHKKECGKCSFESRPSRWDSMRCKAEPLKANINPNDFQSCYFPFDFHTAEWKIEHEKLRMFRETAQAKVDSLAQVLKERRSKWNEEFGTTKGKLRKRSYCKSDKRSCHSEVFNRRSQSAAEEKVSHDKLQAWDTHQIGAGTSFFNANQQPSPTRSAGQASRVDKMSGKEVGGGSRTSCEKRDPLGVQTFYGLPRIVEEEMGDNFDVSFECTADAEPEEKQQSREAHAHEMTACHHTHNHWAAQGKNKLEEEWIVIDDFLAGLHENGPLLFPSTGPTFERGEKKCASGRASSFVRSYSQRTLNDCTASSRMQPPTTTFLHAHNKCTLERAEEADQPWKARLLSSAPPQHKQSEQQLLRTLERLRDKTKSVAATLESMNEARIFPGNYPVPASIIAT